MHLAFRRLLTTMSLAVLLSTSGAWAGLVEAPTPPANPQPVIAATTTDLPDGTTLTAVHVTFADGTTCHALIVPSGMIGSCPDVVPSLPHARTTNGGDGGQPGQP